MNELRAFFDHPAVLSLAGAVVHLYLLWYLYIIVMGLYRAKLMGALTRSASILGAPALVMGIVLDWLANVLLSVVFRELPAYPRELLSHRLQRYIAGPPCINRHYAQIICLHLLDPFDPSGSHCA